MVRVLVEDDVVTVPEPAVGVGVFERCDAEEEAVEAEAVAASAFQAKDVAGAKDPREAPPRPRTIAGKTRVPPSAAVSRPTLFPGVHARGVGVPLPPAAPAAPAP